MFKVNNKNTKTTPLTSLVFLLLTLNIFYTFFYCFYWPYFSNETILFYMTETLWQKPKYLENEKTFQDETKSIFHPFWRAFNEVNNTIFLENESPTLKERIGFLMFCFYSISVQLNIFRMSSSRLSLELLFIQQIFPYNVIKISSQNCIIKLVKLRLLITTQFIPDNLILSVHFFGL